MNDSQNIKAVVPFLMVEDMVRSLSFYVNGLGFTVGNTWEPNGKLTWCWLQREGASLMLQEYGRNDHRVSVQKCVGVGLCCQCMDALALYQEFLAKGVVVQEPFVGNNLWDVALTDPDGYSIHFES